MAALAILGTLLVTAVIARARLVHQWQLAQRRQIAIKSADRLLCNWWQDPLHLPRQAEGEVPDTNGLWWRTSTRKEPALKDLEVSVVRLEVLDHEQPQDSVALATVEIVLPNQEATAHAP